MAQGMIAILLTLQSVLVWSIGCSPWVVVVAVMSTWGWWGVTWWIQRWRTDLQLAASVRWSLVSFIALAGLAVTLAWLAAVRTRDPDVRWAVVIWQALCGGLLVVQAALLWLRLDRQPIPVLLPNLSLLTLALIFTAPLEAGERGLLTLMAISAGLLVSLVYPWTVSAERSGDGVRDSNRSSLTGVVVLATGLTAWVLCSSWEFTVRRLQAWVPQWLGDSGDTGEVRAYPQSGMLGAVSREQLIDPMEVALRVYADRAPGYLRGRVYDLFDRSRWRLASQRSGKWNRLENKQIRTPLTGRPAGVSRPPAEQQTFALRSGGAPWRRMEIHNDPERGRVFFLPLGVHVIQATAKTIATDEHLAIHAGIDPSSPYTAYASAGPLREELSEPLRQLLLAPLGGLDSRVELLAAEVAGDLREPRAVIDAVERFFQENYEYRLEPFRMPPGVEPLSYFLLERPPAYCEFFASGAAALLRLRGIPCRYVTGYLVTEFYDESDEYFLARNRHAHAWVEAYDDSSGEWVIVEATPGMSFSDESLGSTSGHHNPADDSRAAEKGGAHRAWSWLRSVIGDSIGTWWGIAAAAAVGSLLLVWWRQRVRAGLTAFGGWFGRPARRPQQLLRQLDRQLGRRHWIRPAHETLHRFAARLQAGASDDPWLRACAEWYRAYAEATYRGVVPVGAHTGTHQFPGIPSELPPRPRSQESA